MRQETTILQKSNPLLTRLPETNVHGIIHNARMQLHGRDNVLEQTYQMGAD